MSTDRNNIYKNYNPDILETIANLSNDEVFTPPKLANEILDLLPEEVWSNPNLTFLDPAVKTGIFLREIASRLIDGLADQIPDLQERVNHILTKQVFGIGITELTTLMARRTVYCSTTANGPFSIVTEFDDEKGNILLPDTEHTWDKNGRCKFCGANRDNYGGGANKESYAYPFIHDNFEKEFGNMKFDVIIGNPPYQLNDGGAGNSSVPLYHLFVNKAKELNPKYISMIIPSRWFSGGKGLNDFRETMLNDKRMKSIVDFSYSSDCFKGVSIPGGINYFLWHKEHLGKCLVVNKEQGNVVSSEERYLLEDGLDIFIRDNRHLSILKKVNKLEKNKDRFSKVVSVRQPFGIPSNFADYSLNSDETNNIKIYGNSFQGYISDSKIAIEKGKINDPKIFIGRAYGQGDKPPYKVINTPIIDFGPSVCTETYLIIHPIQKEHLENVASYMKTKFFRFLVLLTKNTQDAPRRVYQFVPLLDFSRKWTDKELYVKYGLTDFEINTIETLITNEL